MTEDHQDSKNDTSPTIVPKANGPYLVKNLSTLTNSKGDSLETKPVMALCRCGQSGRKPFCDGTHTKVGFNSEREATDSREKVDTYLGKDITIHDNRGLCAHAGICTDTLGAVFRMGKEPWIDPEGAGLDEMTRIIGQCPSGALQYSLAGKIQPDGNQPDHHGGPQLVVSKDGPLYASGGIAWKGEEATMERYALCRCGASKNKPFCDGSHWQIKFKDENN